MSAFSHKRTLAVENLLEGPAGMDEVINQAIKALELRPSQVELFLQEGANIIR